MAGEGEASILRIDGNGDGDWEGVQWLVEKGCVRLVALEISLRRAALRLHGLTTGDWEREVAA